LPHRRISSLATSALELIIKKELQKNPPVNEQMIRAMFLQMGRKPSEAQIEP
jgi:uncharacterized protein YneF (UPF0154 family)